MKKILPIFLLIFCGFSSFCQEDELNKLTDIVLSLKNGGEKSFQKAVERLSTDPLWTPMDELGINRTAECKASDKTPGFRLNALLTNAENSNRFQTTTGNHLNGADSRYNYSLYEKTLKAHHSVCYHLNQRWGEQTFIAIPYSGKISVNIKSGDQLFKSSSMGNGAIRLTGVAKKDSPLQIEVTNEGDNNVSYILINYNSRK